MFRDKSSWFRVECFGVWVQFSVFGGWIADLWFHGVGFRLSGLGFRVQSSGFMAQGFRVSGCGSGFRM
jgi:hypothetical protein